MSFGNLRIFSSVQEVLVLALMLVAIFAIFYLDVDFTYKIGIGVLAFSIMFLATLGAQILRQQKESIKKAQA